MNYILIKDGIIYKQNIIKLYPDVSSDELSLYVFDDNNQNDINYSYCYLLFKRQDGIIIGPVCANEVTAEHPISHLSNRSYRYIFKEADPILAIPGELGITIQLCKDNNKKTVCHTACRVNNSIAIQETTNLATIQAQLNQLVDLNLKGAASSFRRTVNGITYTISIGDQGQLLINNGISTKELVPEATISEIDDIFLEGGNNYE